MNTQKKWGRPPIENPKSQRLALRVTPDEKEEIQRFMSESGYSLLELIQAGMKSVKPKK